MKPEGPKGHPTLCTCTGDGFVALPPELRPRPQKKASLRQVTCPGCRLVYWTNRATDFCMECKTHFAPEFSERVWDWAQVLVAGAILAPGKRTVTSALRVMGLSEEQQFQNYHREY